MEASSMYEVEKMRCVGVRKESRGMVLITLLCFR